MTAKIRSFVRGVLGRRSLERDMDAEMRFHMEAYEEDLIESSVPVVEAKRRARAEFGSAQLFKDECRDAKGLHWPDELIRNVRFALRVLRKSPGFAVASIGTLALCIGANTAIFSVVDAVLFRPLPFPEPERLVRVVTVTQSPQGDGLNESQDGTTWEVLKGSRTVQVAATSGGFTGVNMVADHRAIYAQQQRVTAGYFRVLGVSPLLGREFTEEEDRPNGPAVAMLSYAAWTTWFGGDPQIAGKQVLLRGEPHTIVGVAPPALRSILPADVWTPLRPVRTGEGSGPNYMLLARLRPGALLPQVHAEMRALGPAALREWNLDPGVTARLDVDPLAQSLAASYRKPLYLLWAAVGIVLLIGCVNIAALTLSRAAIRAQEIGTRLALGGGRGAVIRQLLTESLVVSVFGGFAGVITGYLAIEALGAALARFGIWQEAALDTRVLLASIVLTIVTGLLFGLAPAWHASCVDVRTSLMDGGSRGVAGGRSHWTHRLLVVSEVSLGLVLLVGAGLLIRTLLNLQNLRPGFDPRGVLVASVSLQDARYRTAAQVAGLFDKSLANMRSTGGVESAAAALHVPYERWLNCGTRVVDGPSARPATSGTTANYVTADYFKTLRIPLREGRAIDSRDAANTELVAVLNERYVRRYFHGESPVGRHILLRIDKAPRLVVGVVGDLQQRQDFTGAAQLETSAAVYIPVSQVPDPVMAMVHVWFTPKWIVRSALAKENIAVSLRQAVESVDPMLPFASFQSATELRNASLGWQRATAALFGSLAGLALLLAVIGIYGLIANSVVERTREVGIRIALGASVRSIVLHAAAPGIVLTGVGVFLGSGAAISAVRLMRSMLFGVDPADPLTIAMVGVILIVIAGVASLIPALRLARVDPARTLRQE